MQIKIIRKVSFTANKRLSRYALWNNLWKYFENKVNVLNISVVSNRRRSIIADIEENRIVIKIIRKWNMNMTAMEKKITHSQFITKMSLKAIWVTNTILYSQCKKTNILTLFYNTYSRSKYNNFLNAKHCFVSRKTQKYIYNNFSWV